MKNVILGRCNLVFEVDKKSSELSCYMLSINSFDILPHSNIDIILWGVWGDYSSDIEEEPIQWEIKVSRRKVLSSTLLHWE